MKKQLILGVLVSLTLSGFAQTLKVAQSGNNIAYAFPAEAVGKMPFIASATVSILGHEFPLDQYTISTDFSTAPADNTVAVTYSGSSAQVLIAGNLVGLVSASVSGAVVEITPAADLAEEVTYTLSGSSTSGSFTLGGSFKSTIELNGLTLTSQSGPAINVTNGKRLNLKVVEGTVNTLSDAAGGDHKAALYCKGHMEIKQKGTLNVCGLTNHAIFAKEYLTIKNATINVTSAAKDGINCNQYFLMESGTVTLQGIGDDGIQVSFKDETDREADDTSTCTIAGGTITATCTAPATWDSAAAKTKSAACIKSDGPVNIEGGSLTLTATGGGGKGISCDGVLTIAGGAIDITTTGGLAYWNGSTMNQNYTGNSDNIASARKSSPKGIKCDTDITISGGNITIHTSGNGGEGIESKNILTVTDGTIFIKAYDDAINSSKNMYLKGGTVTAIATNNDGIDSNASIYISGGNIMAFGAGSPEMGFDVDSPGIVSFTGGTLLGIGGGNSVPTSSSGSTQPFVSGSITATAGGTITISSGSETLATFQIPTEYTGTSSGSNPRMGPGGWGGGPGGMSSGGGCVISTPALRSGTAYTVSNGTTSTTLTAKTY